MSAKIILVDIETAPGLGYVWGKYDQNVLAFRKHSYMLAYSWKVYGEQEVFVKTLADYPGFKKDHSYDGDLVSDLWKVFDDADILVAHNGDNFDIKFSNSRFAVHGLHPPSTYKTVDTLKIAKKHFRFESNKLDDLGQHLECGRKASSGGLGTWLACLQGDVDAFKRMAEYNAQDVLLLEAVYTKVRGWATTHPNLNIYEKTKGLCPTCGSNHVQRRGFAHKNATVYQRWQCQADDCGRWFQTERIKKSEMNEEG